MKTCKVCSVNKPYSEFFKDKGLLDGRSNTCKICKTKKTYAWREANLDKYNAYMREKNKEAYPTARLQRYGVTKEWFDDTLAAQGNLCAICSKSNPSKKRCLAVDHHHLTGKVRGIVCYNCNRLLHAFDDPVLFERLLAYVGKHK